MSDFDSDGSPDQEWEERGELAWNEFDWERYLREQDEAIHRYLQFYESSRKEPDRIDLVAQKMGWSHALVDEPEADSDATVGDDDEVYTLHKNPIFVATKAISLGLRRSWESLARENPLVPRTLAVELLASLHQTEEHATQAIHALDFGDYAMAVSLFKRALSSLNRNLALINGDETQDLTPVASWREDAQPRLFDLREIWLRVIAECRDELERPVDDES